jgi:hypothetical protein
MSGKFITVLVVLGTVSSAAVALTVTRSDFGGAVHERTFPTKAEFDRTFAEFATPTALERDAAADREKLRMAGLKRMTPGLGE